MPPPVALPSPPLVPRGHWSTNRRRDSGSTTPPRSRPRFAAPYDSIHSRSLRVCGVRLHNGLPRRAAADHHSVRQEGPVRRRTRANERTYVAVAVAVAVSAFCRPGQASTLALSGAVSAFACLLVRRLRMVSAYVLCVVQACRSRYARTCGAVMKIRTNVCSQTSNTNTHTMKQRTPFLLFCLEQCFALSLPMHSHTNSSQCWRRRSHLVRLSFLCRMRRSHARSLQLC